MFKLPELNYDLAALSPWVSAATMDAHHNHHHQTYVDKLNAAVEQLPAEIRDYYFSDETSAERLRAFLDDVAVGSFDQDLDAKLKTTLKNMGGGHFNHSLFWQMLTPKSDGQPGGELGRKLNEKYGSFKEFTNQFEAAATTLFGSGWAWLDEELAIVTTPNQDIPTNEVLLGFDAWEHAYYLDYKWDRASYAKAWWDHVNWDFVAERFAKLSDK